jgi:release factor glutamine methyltransferase
VTIQEILAALREKFRQAGIESWETDARMLVQHALGVSREELLLNNNRILSISESETLNRYAERRLKHEPVSRILGVRSFWKSDFKITRETLDPRADSETLMEAALKHANNPVHVLDLGTGSGCLLLSLLQEWPQILGTGVDISVGAVGVAEENAKNLGLSHRATFVAGDWSDIGFSHKFDVVISNPPYITKDEMAALAPEVSLYDPHGALAGGDDGLECYRSIIKLLPDILNQNGYLFFEVGYRQAAAVKELLEKAGLDVLEILPDLAGNERCVVAHVKSL